MILPVRISVSYNQIWKTNTLAGRPGYRDNKCMILWGHFRSLLYIELFNSEVTLFQLVSDEASKPLTQGQRWISREVLYVCKKCKLNMQEKINIWQNISEMLFIFHW